MAFRTKKISQMDPKGSNLASTDLLEISQLVSGSYVTKSITGAEIISGATTGFVPTSRTLTINGTTQDLSADRTFTISTGITIGTTAITSGTVGRVLFEGTGNVVQESANLFWDNTNGRLGIGTSSPSNSLTIKTGVNDDGILLESSVGNPLFLVRKDGTSNSTAELFQYANGSIRLAIRSTSNFSYFNGGNFGFGTTTDAGFRLDVNGTARVTGTASFNTGIIIGVGASTAGIIPTGTSGQESLSVRSGLVPSSSGTDIVLTNGQGDVAITTSTRTMVVINRGFNPTSGNGVYNLLAVTPNINQTGTANGAVRGFYYNPTLTSVLGTHHAFHSTSGRIRFENLPTSATGLSAGDIWNDAGTLKIV